MTVDWDDPDFEPDVLELIDSRPRDRAIDEAKKDLEIFFKANENSVFYQRQIQVIFEDKYFHWITAYSLSELSQEGKIASDVLTLAGTGKITIYRRKGHRYP